MDVQLQLCELEAQLQTERSTNKAIRAFLDQGRIERDNVYREKERLEQLNSQLREENDRLVIELRTASKDKENSKPQIAAQSGVKSKEISDHAIEALRETEKRARLAEAKSLQLGADLDAARTRARIVDAEMAALAEKVRLTATEKESLAVQLKTQRRLVNEQRQKIFHLEISDHKVQDKKVQSQILLENASLANKISDLSAQLAHARTEKHSLEQEMQEIAILRAEIGKLEKLQDVKTAQDERLVEISAQLEQSSLKLAEVIRSHDFEIQVKDECSRKLQTEISDLKQKLCFIRHKDCRDLSTQTQAIQVSHQLVQAQDNQTVYRKLQTSLRKLKNFICCFSCRRSGAGLLVLVPCGHHICPGCHDDALTADRLLEGIRCGECRAISDFALPSTSAGKLLEILSAIEHELK